MSAWGWKHAAGSPLPRADVILAGSESRGSLAFARSLARSDVSFVFATEIVRGGIVAASRSVNRTVLMPSVRHEADGYAERLVGLTAETGARVVVPVNDSTLRVVNDHRSAIEAAGAVPAIGPEASVRNILDKRAHLDTAKRLGVPCPVEFELTGVAQIPELIEHVGFPMVLKRPRAGRGSYKWLVVDDEHELRSTLEGSHAEGDYPICQELVKGSVVGLYYFATKGEIRALHTSVAMRRSKGENVYRRIIPTDPALEGHARNLARELEWEGLGTLAFFVTPDGDSKYMEMNGRMWGTLEGSIHAGWDMPMWTVRYFADGVLPEPPPIGLGSRSCWHVGDLVHLWLVLAGRRSLVDFRDVPRFRAVLEYLAAWGPHVHSDVFRLNDPLPELVEHWNAIRPIAGDVRRRLVPRVRR
jgi:predicted ATP-grasp superfamily ATP-dependent carboligase